MAARLAPINWGWLAGFTGISIVVGFLAGVDPKAAIAASIAIGFVLVVFADLTAGLAIFGFFSFLELLHVGSAISVSKLGGVLLALGWFAFVLSREGAKSDFLAVHPAMSLVLGMFMGWVALSALWAESTAVVVSSFGRYLLNAILFLIVFTAIRDRRQATLVIAGFLAGAVAAGVYGLVFATVAVQGYGGRLTGSNLDPNELASVLVAGLALSVGLAASLKGKYGLRLATLAAGGFCFLATMLTGSRGGLVALGCMLIAAIVFAGRWRPRVAVTGILVALLAVFYISALAPAGVRDRIKSTQGESPVLEGRTTLWQIGERMVRAHPVNGVGAGNFQTSSRHYLLQPGTLFRTDVVLIGNQVTHNTYLQTAAELGIVGLVLFGSIIVFSLGCSVRAVAHFRKRGDVPGEVLARSVTVAMVGLLVADFFISQMFNKQLWLMLGIGPAMLAISQRSGAKSAGR
jgi:O-antigen ligase